MNKFVFYLLVCLTSIGYAQDQLFKRDNSKLDVKILEINPTEIKYKLFTYQDGPTITIAKKEVALIIYQNGVHEVITTEAPTPVVQPTPQPIVVYKEYISPRINYDSINDAKMKDLLSTKNYISMNILEPINGSFNISYLREFAMNYLHVYVPVSVGFTSPHFTQISNTLFTGYSESYAYSGKDYFSVSDFLFTNKTYEIGLGLHFQSSCKKQVTHFIGPYIGQAQFTGTYNKTAYTYNQTSGYYTSKYTELNKFTMDRLYLMLDNGVLFRPTKNFNIMLLVGLGYHIDTFKGEDLTKSTNYRTPQQRVFPLNAYKFGVNFGYRF